jgi:hypothetical protein
LGRPTKKEREFQKTTWQKTPTYILRNLELDACRIVSAEHARSRAPAKIMKTDKNSTGFFCLPPPPQLQTGGLET